MEANPNIFVRAALAFIRFYRNVLSPMLHIVFGGESFCRFTPTCSEYARQSLLTHGFLKGLALSTWRIIRCNPFCAGGADPVPAKGEWQSRSERLGIFGGTFDPIHNGHLTLAETAKESLKLDRIIFVPVAKSPLKENNSIASDEDRLQMLQAVLHNRPGIELSALEIERGGISYSIDTAKFFAATYPKAQIFWLIGADQFSDLAKWKDIEDLSHIVTFIVMKRNSDILPPLSSDLAKFVSFIPLDISPVDISSSEIRQKISTGVYDSLVKELPADLIKIIEIKKLYGYKGIFKK